MTTYWVKVAINLDGVTYSLDGSDVPDQPDGHGPPLTFMGTLIGTVSTPVTISSNGGSSYYTAFRHLRRSDFMVAKTDIGMRAKRS